MMRIQIGFLTFCIATGSLSVMAGTPVDDLPDLTGGVVPVIQYKNHDPFSGSELTSISEVEYTVRVKNQTGDPLVADSLILVVDSIREISGKEIADRIHIEAIDGTTAEGKPFFRIPYSDEDLAPYAESESVTIRVRNPDYLRFFPPGVRVRGLRRSANSSVKDLLETLVQKGVLSPEEAGKALTAPQTPSQ